LSVPPGIRRPDAQPTGFEGSTLRVASVSPVRTGPTAGTESAAAAGRAAAAANRLSAETRLLRPPTARILLDNFTRDPPLTRRLLLSHPCSRRDLLAIVPWTLLSALGFVALLDLIYVPATFRAALASLIVAGAIFHGAAYLRSYFRDYPTLAAPYFKYGMEQVVRAVGPLGSGRAAVAISPKVTQPYIYVLFFEKYPPRRFQRQRVGRRKRLFAPVLKFDRYNFYSARNLYQVFPHGAFVFTGSEPLPSSPTLSVRYPDGSVAYNVLIK